MKDACARLRITDRQMRNLIAEHENIPVVGRGKDRVFLWPDLGDWRDQQLIQQGVRSVRPQSIEEARARKLTAEADLMEIELAEKRGTLMPSAVFRQEFEGACARLRAHQLNAPTRYGPQLLAALSDITKMEDLRRIEEFLEGMMREQMTELQSDDDIPDDDEEAA